MLCQHRAARDEDFAYTIRSTKPISLPDETPGRCWGSHFVSGKTTIADHAGRAPGVLALAARLPEEGLGRPAGEQT